MRPSPQKVEEWGDCAVLERAAWNMTQEPKRSILDMLDEPSPENKVVTASQESPKAIPYGPSGRSMMCLLHESTFTAGDECYFCKNGLERSDINWKTLELRPRARRKLQKSPKAAVVEFPGSTPVAVARRSDPVSSHHSALKIPTEKLWERMIKIRNLVLANPRQCIRWYCNKLAEETPAPELDSPGCRDSVHAPKHDVGYYGVIAPLFAQAERHGLIVKVTDPLAPTEKLMARSPYPGESLAHLYEACTVANMQRMEAERIAYFERVEAQRVADREARAADSRSTTPDEEGIAEIAEMRDIQPSPVLLNPSGRH